MTSYVRGRLGLILTRRRGDVEGEQERALVGSCGGRRIESIKLRDERRQVRGRNIYLAGKNLLTTGSGEDKLMDNLIVSML